MSNQGGHVDGLLPLPDGQLVGFDVRENRTDRSHARSANWAPVDYRDRQYDIAQSILASPDVADFDTNVQLMLRYNFESLPQGRVR